MSAETAATTIRAGVSRGYLMRLGIVGLFCAFGAAYFYYDHKMGYPAEREAGLAYLEFKEERENEKDELEILEEWKVYAVEKGWRPENPLDPETNEPRSEIDIQGQLYWAMLAGVIAFGFLARFAWMLTRWVECDEASLRDAAGRETRFSHITELDKKKWSNKGIAFAHYKTEKGASGKIRLDDFYFDREATKQILRRVEANIDPAKITNGKPEPPEEAEVKEAAT
jgi:hypothetical protein